LGTIFFGLQILEILCQLAQIFLPFLKFNILNFLTTKEGWEDKFFPPLVFVLVGYEILDKHPVSASLIKGTDA
jgi:hypothetical protein